jgi:hypothetical protein
LEASWTELEASWPQGKFHGFDITKPTKKGVSAIEQCERLHQEIDDIYNNERPETDPASKKARKKRDQVLISMEIITKDRDTLTYFKKDYIESPYYVDFKMITAQAQNWVQQRAFSEAATVIEKGLQFDPENEFLRYLENICLEQLNKRKRIFGIF